MWQWSSVNSLVSVVVPCVGNCTEAKDGSLFGAEENVAIVSDVGDQVDAISISAALPEVSCATVSTVAAPAEEFSSAVPAAAVSSETTTPSISVAVVASAEAILSSSADADFDLDAEVDGLVGSVDVNQPIEGNFCTECVGLLFPDSILTLFSHFCQMQSSLRPIFRFRARRGVGIGMIFFCLIVCRPIQSIIFCQCRVPSD